MRSLLSLILVFASACELVDPDPPEPPALAELDIHGGGGDAGFYALAARGNEVIARFSIYINGLLSEAAAAGETITISLEVGDPELSVNLQTGDPLSTLGAGDSNGGPERNLVTYEAVAGSATLVVTAEPTEVEDCPTGHGHAVVEGLVVELDGVRTELGSIEIEALDLGWYPDNC